MVLCCIPEDIVKCTVPEILDTKTAVRVYCNNPMCWVSGLVHEGCFYKWEATVVKYLVNQEENGVNAKMLETHLWTSGMWELPLPKKLTHCKCGEGDIKRLVGEIDEISSENKVFKNNENSCVIVDNSVGGGGDSVKEFEQNIKVQSDDGRWEVVSRNKVKNKNNNASKIFTRKQKKGSSNKSRVEVSQPNIPIAGPDPVKEYQTATKPGKPEGKRDSTGLIHCISCKTVHLSLPDFIQHCKSSQHSRQVLGDMNNNDNNSGEIVELRSEVYNVKKGLVEIMKQRLDQDITAKMELEDFKESCKRESAQERSVLALLIEKFQILEDKHGAMEEKFASLASLVQSNEEDLDRCFDCIQDITKNIENLTKEVKKKIRNKGSIENVEATSEEHKIPREGKESFVHDEQKFMHAQVYGSNLTVFVLLVLLSLVTAAFASFLAFAWR